jgi:hypothetical protein
VGGLLFGAEKEGVRVSGALFGAEMERVPPDGRCTIAWRRGSGSDAEGGCRRGELAKFPNPA